VDDDRLKRIENKMDELTKVVTELARIEERMITLFKRMDRYELQQNTIADRLAEIERITVSRGVFHQAFEKGFWLFIGAALSAGVAWATKNGGAN